MVVKLVASKGTGSYGGLANYILDKSHDGSKVVDTEFTNCPYPSTEKNLSFLKKMQDLNQSAKSDKTMHLIVSFREGEISSKDTLKDIEHELLKSIGMESHHRLSVTHNNTANFHIHIAINGIHPETKKLIDPWQSKKKLDRKVIELEERHHLQKDNHAPNDLLKQAGIMF